MVTKLVPPSDPFLRKSFSAGVDLKMIRDQTGLNLRRFLEKLYFAMHDAQYRTGKPTIAVAKNLERAADVTLAVSCDCLIIANDVNISYSEIIVGVIPASHFVHFLYQAGRHKAFENLNANDTMSVL